MNLKRYIIPVLLCLAAVSTACTFLQKNQVLAMIVVQQATTRYIEQAPDKAVRAAAVRKVAEQIKAVAASDKVSIDGLKALALKEIAKANLKPSDALLANTLVEASVAALLEKVKTGELDADAKVAVNKLIDWVLSASNLYS